MAPKKSMKTRILDYVTETPRSAIEIYDIMCTDGFTYGGKTPQYTTQSMLGTHYKNGRISREMEENGEVCGRKLQNIGCGPGCSGTYYYFKPDPNASLTVSVELRAIFAKLGPKVFAKQTKVLTNEAKSEAKLTKMRKKVGWISLKLGIALIVCGFGLLSWVHSSPEWITAYELAKHGFQLIEGTNQFEPISWYNWLRYKEAPAGFSILLGGCLIFASLVMLLYRRKKKPQPKSAHEGET